MAAIPGVCGFHTLRFMQEFRYAVKIVCDRCSCTVQTNGLGYGYFTCDQCGFKACESCASLIQGQTKNNVGQVQESSSGPIAGLPWLSWVQQQPSINPPDPFASSATTNHSPASQLSSSYYPPNPFASSATTNHTPASQQRSNYYPPNPFVSSATTTHWPASQQRSNYYPPNPFASSAATNHSESQQQRSNLPNPFASSAATSSSQSQQQWSNLPTSLTDQSSHASPLGRGFDDVGIVSNEDDEKQPVIPCRGSLAHELQFLQKSPYIQHGLFGCNMCWKGGSKDLYHCEICQFDTHKACAEIQEHVKVFFHKHPLQRDLMDDEEFTCRICVGDTEPDIRPWVYKCLICPNFAVHARCAKYAKSLRHESHPHTLKLVQNPVIDGFPEKRCDGCWKSIHQGYHYTCTEQTCDFDLHPSCAILPTSPLCLLNSTHRVKLEYHLQASCHLCDLHPSDEVYWMYRCTVCDVCMHINCFNLDRSGSDEELSDGDEDLSDGDEDLDDVVELYQFFQSLEGFGSQGNEELVEKLSELVDSFKSITKARSSLARQHSVRSSLYPRISTPAQSEVHILDDGFANMMLGESSRSEDRNRESAEEEERRRAEQQKAERKREKAERKREKAAARALQEKENVAWREEVANKLQSIQYHQQSGSNNVAIAKQVAEVQACLENYIASDTKRHQEQTKLHQERHQEYMTGLHEIIRTQVHSTTRAVPRLVLCSETTSYRRKLLTVLRAGIKCVRLDLLCEHAEQPHVVSGASGCEINQKVAGERWTKLQPFLAAGVQIVTLAVNFAGMGALGNVLPDFHQKVWDIQAVDLGEHAIRTGRNEPAPRPDPGAEEVAADWLNSYLRDQNINIAESFKLHRVRYKYPDHVKGTVGWLCREHLAKGMKDLELDRFPG